MWDVKACTVCLSHNVKLFDMDTGDLRAIFNLVSGLQTRTRDGLPHYLCVECCSFVKRSKMFRDKCQKAHFTLLQVLHFKKQITLSSLKALDRKSIGIAPTGVKFDIEKSNIVDYHISDCNTNSLGGNTSYAYNENQLDEKTCIKQEKKESKVTITLSAQRFTDDGIPDDGDSFDNVDEEGLNTVTKCEKLKDNEPNIEEEFVNILPITMQEARAAYEIEKLSKPPIMGDYVCKICGKVYRNYRNNKALFKQHQKKHDAYLNGSFLCEICKYCYKTQALLDVHMNSSHNYKYVCTQCNEVTFDRASAKYHFSLKHMDKNSDKRPSWFPKRVKKQPKLKVKRKAKSWTAMNSNEENKLKEEEDQMELKAVESAPDFPLITSIKHEEQYQIVQERKKSQTYIKSPYKCELCFKAFRNKFTYDRHLVKHDPSKSGPFECDACHFRFHDTRGVYSHMFKMHLKRYSCRMCDYVNYNRSQAIQHYRWHKKVTYKCEFCNKVFNKRSSCLTHVRLKHTSLHVCRLCGHSFVSEHGLNSHGRLCHSNEELKQISAVKVDRGSTLYCADCDVQFLNEEAYETHFGSSVKHAKTNKSGMKRELMYKGEGKKSTSAMNVYKIRASACELCGLELANDYQASKHYKSKHPGEDYLQKIYMCDVCGHTCKVARDLEGHMRTHTRERPYKCSYCDRLFSLKGNRARHISTVHKGEKRYQCQQCKRRFTQSCGLKLHVQTVHLKIPYAPWVKASRKRKEKRKQLEMGVLEDPNINSQQIHTEQSDYETDYMQEYKELL